MSVLALRLDNYLRTCIKKSLPVAVRWFSVLCCSLPSLASLASQGRLAVRHRRNSEMITGTVKFFNSDKGYGFIQPEDGSSDAFVHISAVEASGMGTLDRDQRVTYDLENDRRGRASAVNLQSA